MQILGISVLVRFSCPYVLNVLKGCVGFIHLIGRSSSKPYSYGEEVVLVQFSTT